MTQPILAFLSDAAFTKHLTGPSHPEQPERIIAIKRAIKQHHVMQHIPWITPRMATESEIALCHTPEYIALVQEETARLIKEHLPNDGSSWLSTGDAPICSASYEVAKLAVGSALTAVDHVLQNQSLRVFCAVRPPGHHAFRAEGKGFCLFNNVAIAARYAQKKYGVEKILIVDWDVHHGDGTQAIFYQDPSVFYFSSHRYGRGYYPGTGSALEIGEGEGAGSTLNCPYFLEMGESPRLCVLKAFKESLPAAVQHFHPDLIFISAGFDAHLKDPLGGCNLTEEDFATLTEEVKALARQYCQNRIISVLEGGYHLEGLSASVLAHVLSLSEL